MADSPLANFDISTQLFGGAGTFNNALGTPPNFSWETDPSGRVYSRCLSHNAPILSITPGVPDFKSLTNADAEVQEVINKIAQSETEALNKSGSSSNIDDIEKQLELLKGKVADSRYFHLAPAGLEYLMILNNMLARVNSRIDTGILVAKFPELTGWSNLNIYCTNRTSISESANNDYGASMLEGVTSGISDKMKEIWFTTGQGSSTNESDSAIKEAQSRTLEAMEGGFMSGAGSLYNGEKLMLPKIWKNSTFSKSYNLNFKFESPYGDAKSIFEEVITPYLALLALSLPRQTGLSAYKDPFLVRIESPG
jgi:hypothetical protein